MKNLYFTIFVLLLVSINTYSQIPSYVPTNGLVGWWPFNGNANDESGNGNNGTVNGASLTTDRLSLSNNAYLFNGSSSFINVPNSASLQFNGGITFSTWLYASAFPSPVAYWFSKGADGGTPYSWTSSVDAATKKASVSIYNNNNQNCGASSTTSLQLNTWIHVVHSFDGSFAKTYVNGVLESNVSCSYSTFSNSYALIFGKRHISGLPYFWNGKIDDFGLWNRALTQQEITNLYNSCTNQIVTMNSVPNVVFKTSSAIQLVGNPSGGTFSGEAVVGTTFTPANATLGKKTISYNYTSPQGCSGNASQTTIVVDSVGNVCSTYDTLRIQVHFTAGLYANTTNTVKFYPNPTNDILFIDNGNYQAMSGYTIKIVSLTGAIIYNQPITSQQVQISMNQFATKGLYYAQIFDPNNQLVDAKKIVLE